LSERVRLQKDLVQASLATSTQAAAQPEMNWQIARAAECSLQDHATADIPNTLTT